MGAVDLVWGGRVRCGIWKRVGGQLRWEVGTGGRGGERTASMAFLTRSDVMKPLLARFLIRAALEEPEDILIEFLLASISGRDPGH